jgi:hypothetical protein
VPAPDFQGSDLFYGEGNKLCDRAVKYFGMQPSVAQLIARPLEGQLLYDSLLDRRLVT